MENNSIMRKFNEYNDLSQELIFLNTKYSRLLRLDEWERKYFKDLLIKNNLFSQFVSEDIDKMQDIGLMKFLDKISESQKKKLLWILFMCQKTYDSEKKNIYKIQIESILYDFKKYTETKKSLEELESETTENKNNKVLFSYLSKTINSELKLALSSKSDMTDKEKTIIINTLKDQDDPFVDIEDNKENTQSVTSKEELLSPLLRENIKNKFLDPLVFFHTIQSVFRKYNYVLTFEDIGRLKKIMWEIEKWKMVFLSWDTWSGKTELTILIANLYIQQKNEIDNWKRKWPIIVWWQKETDISDFTLEKIITSRNWLSTQKNDVIPWGQEFDIQKKLFDQIIQTDEIKKSMYDAIDEMEILDEEKKRLKASIDDTDLTKYNIFTEYHLKWLFKAMYDWVPLIVDEMNAIRPEILIWINHYLTRKVWQKIWLPNWLWSFMIKEWFCIMCSGNDKDANSKKEMYQSRYTIDESLINRMTILDKWYMRQWITTHNNNNSLWLNETESTIDYLNENEIYWVLLMLFFDSKSEKNDWDMHDLRLTKKNKTAFDLIKEEYIGKNDDEKKELFFDELKKFSHFIKLIQNAYEQKWSVMVDGHDISNLIKRRVISMRQIRSILTEYQKDTKSLFYHIYNNYISQWGWSSDELIWILYASKESWLFPLQVSGWLNIEWEWLEKIKNTLGKLFLEEKNTNISEKKLTDAHDKKIIINDDLLDSRLILTKQDIYKQYFWKDLDTISDTDILWNNEDTKHIFEQFEQWSVQNNPNEAIDENKNKNIEEITEQAEQILLLQKNENEVENAFFNRLAYQIFFALTSCCQNIIDQKIINLDQTKINWIYLILNKILVYISEGQNISIDEIENTILSLQKIMN